jgi:histidinol-phosphatase (PHP family)
MIDFHTHTYLCGHATGTAEEYVEMAIKRGVKIYGVSDHAPLPDHLREGVTMREDQAEPYILSVQKAAEKFKDIIEVKVGFEVDYPFFETFITDYFVDERVDYLVGSVHLLHGLPIDHSGHMELWETRDKDYIYEEYYKRVNEMVLTGKINIVGHLDLPKKYGTRPAKDHSELIRTIAKNARNSNTAVELNTAGLRKPVKEIYPSREIVEILVDEKTPLTLGSDAHSPEDVAYGFDRALALLKEYGVTKLSTFTKRERSEIEI